MAKLKICGLRRTEDAEFLNMAKADYAGFILTPGFRRSIDRVTAKRLRAVLSPDIKTVGVFVNDSMENIRYFLQNGIIDMVQLHGEESPEFCARINAPVIKYFDPAGFGRIRAYDTDYCLFDSGTGTGRTFDWGTIPKTDKPFFLAGGLNVQNIPEALKTVRPYCIDVSSSVETDGVKDLNKIMKITECVRNA